MASRKLLVHGCFGLVAALFWGALPAQAQVTDGSGNPAVASRSGGKALDKDGNPTFDIKPDGTVDWQTQSGFVRYHAECHVCHGPDGMGSSYAPALVNSLKTLNYNDFIGVVTNGRINVTTSQDNVMPKFGLNANVMCYVDDIYVYLRARADNAVPRGRPAAHAPKDPEIAKSEDACMS